MRIEILILTALLTTNAALPKMAFPGGPRIVGGEEAPLHKFSYQVVLLTTDPKKVFSGALITDRWVISTARIVKNSLPVENALVLLGAQDPNVKEVTQQKIGIDQKILHESFDGLLVNDIALLHLITAVQLDRFASIIMLAPFNSPDFDGSRLVLSGFGYTSASGTTQSKSLRYVVVNGISNSVCKRMRENITDGQVCVETTGGIGGCWYDEGSPLVDVNSGLLVGLVTAMGGCATPPLPTVFTRISYYEKWIMDNIN